MLAKSLKAEYGAQLATDAAKATLERSEHAIRSAFNSTKQPTREAVALDATDAFAQDTLGWHLPISTLKTGNWRARASKKRHSSIPKTLPPRTM